jgi:hypothetical protein
MEAMREWLRRDGKGSFVALINQSLDIVEAGARLDEIATPSPGSRGAGVGPA